ncbi:MAG: cytochrome b/b6 domain-containing protein [Rickettsiales bacterium]|nr:cytochrome b/b6 domain-containing protein [Rickettsiales bacterium]
MQNENQKYHFALRVIHWAMAVIIIGLLTSGFTKGYLPKEYRGDFYFYHKSFGMIALGLIILRIIIKSLTFKTEPKLPEILGKQNIILAKLGWALLYLFMIFMPLSGYIATDAGDYSLPVFGFQFPDLITKNKPLGRFFWELHETLPWFFVAIISLHFLASVKHYFLDKVNLFKRML